MSDVAEEMREVGPWGQAVAISFRFLSIGAIAIAVGWLVSNIRQVPPDSQAVIVRLEAITRCRPGIALACPRRSSSTRSCRHGLAKSSFRLTALETGAARSIRRIWLCVD